MIEDDVGDFAEVGDLSADGVSDDYVLEECEALSGPASTGRGTPDEVFTFEITTAGDYVVGVAADDGTDTVFGLFDGDLCDTSSTCIGQVDNGVAGDVDVLGFFLPVGTYTMVVDAVDPTFVGGYFVLVTPYVPEQKCASDLFFSEYVESGAGTNKVIEIYNGTGAAVDLADYQIWRANNGADVGVGGMFDLVDADGLSPMLADGATWVICHGQSDPSILALCDQDGGSSLLNNFNGDDYIGLVKFGPTATVIDAIGVAGEDPGTGWPVGTAASTEDFVLWRAPDISSGTADWSIGADEWFALPAETLVETLSNARLGEHEVDWVCVP